MRYFQEKNPQSTYKDMLQLVDRNMFPEYQVMHESPTKIRPLQQQGFLEKLMQMFR